MTTAEILSQARDLISEPACWNQGCAARDANGREIEAPDDGVEAAQHEDAVMWCAGGAIMWVAGDDYASAQYLFERANEIQSVRIGPWNDRATHADVLAAFDRAIAVASAEDQS
jgi:hypothetical protein